MLSNICVSDLKYLCVCFKIFVCMLSNICVAALKNICVSAFAVDFTKLFAHPSIIIPHKTHQIFFQQLSSYPSTILLLQGYNTQVEPLPTIQKDCKPCITARELCDLLGNGNARNFCLS